MSIQIVGTVDKDRLFCSGSFTKLLTTFVTLSLLAEKYDLTTILDDDNFLDVLCVNEKSKKFLKLFQTIIGSQFTIRDICSYYSGLPYTFDVSQHEIEMVDAGQPFKHHSILDEKTFLSMCRHQITPVYPNRSKFHYSELSIIFLGYLIELVYDIKIESLFQKYVIDKFNLIHSLFSRVLVNELFCADFSDKYDYPSIAIADHGYFCYSNGFFTTLADMKLLLENLLKEPIFHNMVDVNNARAASNRLMNGLTIEMRVVGDDLIYGYEGLSFSGCNIWAYSTKKQQGYLTFTESEEDAYTILYDNHLGYTQFDKVPEHTEQIYKNFLKNYDFNSVIEKNIPDEYQGKYQRVTMNEKILTTQFVVANNFIIIRNPDEFKYDVVYLQDTYRIKGKDKVPGTKVGLAKAESGHKYMYFDGTLYKKVM